MEVVTVLSATIPGETLNGAQLRRVFIDIVSDPRSSLIRWAGLHSRSAENALPGRYRDREKIFNRV